MARKILILNGPNLNLLGVREPAIYGDTTLAMIRKMCLKQAAARGLKVAFRQTNHEGVLVTWIQRARGRFDGLIINAAAYTHTSIAIHDALKILEIPVVEVHLSNPKEREAFRHHSYVEAVAARVIAGKGPQGYGDAIDFLAASLITQA